MNGDKIVVYPDDSRMEVLGQNRRVKVILFPGGNPTPGAAAAAGAPTPGAASGAAANLDTESDGAGQGS